MPILKREPDLFPDGLFLLPVDEIPWWVAHARSRQEKGLARYLWHYGIPFYLPQREHRIRRYGRLQTSYMPLFTGYVFFRGTRDDRLAALKSELLVRVLDVPDQVQLDVELKQLRLLQEAGLPIVPQPYIAPGGAVRIADGPFRGYEGVVLREKGKLRLVVSVSMLRRSVSVELDREVLDPLPVIQVARA